MNLYKVELQRNNDSHPTIKSIKHIENNYYYNNLFLFQHGGTDYLIKSGWAFNEEQNFYLFDTHNISFMSGDNPSTSIIGQFKEKLWTIRDDKIQTLIE